MVFNFQPLKEMLDRHCKIPGIILFCKSLHSNLVAKTVARLCVTGFCGHIVAFLFSFFKYRISLYSPGYPGSGYRPS